MFDKELPTLLSTTQVAELLGLKPHTLAVARSDGRSIRIPYFKIGRSVRYRKEEVEAYLRANQVGELLLESLDSRAGRQHP